VKEHGKSYQSFLYLNLEKADDRRHFTDFGDNVYDVLRSIRLTTGASAELTETLLFIDEIQEAPEAIAMLRYFYEELSDLRVIAAGSLLDFALAETGHIPVGRVEQVVLHPVDFSEFLEATSSAHLLEELQSIPLDPVAYAPLIHSFHEYMLIGGMPEIVSTYISLNKQLAPLEPLYGSLWQSCLDDISKHASSEKERKVLRHVTEHIPHVKDRISFEKFGRSDYKSREISEAMETLHRSRLMRLIHPTTSLHPPLVPSLRRRPRVQLLDTGLLNYAAGMQSHLLRIVDMSDTYRGYAINHIVNQELIAQNNRIDYLPRFWVRENSNSNAEVDLLLQHGNSAVPIEIKSGASGRLRSLMECQDRLDHTYAFRLLDNKYHEEILKTRKGKSFTLINLPYFCASVLPAYIEHYLP